MRIGSLVPKASFPLLCWGVREVSDGSLATKRDTRNRWIAGPRIDPKSLTCAALDCLTPPSARTNDDVTPIPDESV